MFQYISDTIINIYDGICKYIVSVKTKINKQRTAKKTSDIKVVNVKIKKVTVTKTNKKETN
ncbi:MAG: hypothetical protein [Wendovervirus sonii]|uniref:Uncharacterized protein n=1 Tax=phage Lak_Megaphage_Sonny TaxID=3109229 RepID=A0ABZ0Z354_9CAUD|nr:MAG: hypothetical protein [phage Lak_Megaphage_Sonny]